MNLFCFSLEGSMDSLYEAVHSSSETQVYTIPSRSCSPAMLLEDTTRWPATGRSVSMEISQINTDHKSNNSKKKKKRTLTKSVSDNEALDNTICANDPWLPSKNHKDLVTTTKTNQNEEPVRKFADAQTEPRHHQMNLEKTEKEPSIQQMVYYEGWNPNKERPNSRPGDVV
ncbi:putative uncharacterized protein ENSP00000383407 [Chanos chanos]|uniref:Uncharacterized protein n=1 Tax=Chanos chanos TaxID=29144 RepID=A0A6J2VM06_CHACN|nr:putative uncharacterized protein ENSP00000383407 [Chanos chanos]